MDFGYDARTLDLRKQLLTFMEERVYPAEAVFAAQVEAAGAQGREWERVPVTADLKADARSRGLWNLFLTGKAAKAVGRLDPSLLPDPQLTNLQYAPLAEVTGWSPALAPEALNCAAPDTGNMELLAEFGSPEQQEQWLRPLLEGTIRSAFCMTEPDVASSDATNIATTITRDGDGYVINGRKWWSSGAMSSDCRIFIVMGVTGEATEGHGRHSMILVPRDTPGITVKRGMMVFGYSDGTHGGHAEVVFDNVRVPVGEPDLRRGRRVRDRAGAPRSRPHPPLHAADRRGRARPRAHVPPGRQPDRVRQDPGRAGRRPGLDRRIQGPDRTGAAARAQDGVADGHRRQQGAHTEIQAIKIVTPAMAQWVIDRAIQAHGGGGVSQDFPLAHLWASARTLRFADGPDEVHKRSLARRELRKATT